MNNVSPISQLTRPSVTKMSNRNHATERLAQEVKRAKEDATYSFSILLVEFYGLSDITDRLGFASGDDVWRRVLSTLHQDLRPGDMCCRLGGDEFLLILPSRGQDDCRAFVDRLHGRWNPGVGTREATIELSIGMATYPEQGATVHQLLGAADEAMQSDKQGAPIRSVPELRQSA